MVDKDHQVARDLYAKARERFYVRETDSGHVIHDRVKGQSVPAADIFPARKITSSSQIGTPADKAHQDYLGKLQSRARELNAGAAEPSSSPTKQRFVPTAKISGPKKSQK